MPTNCRYSLVPSLIAPSIRFMPTEIAARRIWSTRLYTSSRGERFGSPNKSSELIREPVWKHRDLPRSCSCYVSVGQAWGERVRASWSWLRSFSDAAPRSVRNIASREDKSLILYPSAVILSGLPCLWLVVVPLGHVRPRGLQNIARGRDSGQKLAC